MADPSLSSFCRLEYVLKGVRRDGAARPKRHRLPITPDILLSIQWSQGSVDYDKVMLWAAFCLGFFWFLRAAEFTYNPAVNEALLLSVDDIQVDSRHNPRCITVRLKQSKTDPFGVGVVLHLGCTGKVLCPVASMLAFLAIRHPSPGSLFVFKDGTPLSRERLVVALRQVLGDIGMSCSV